MWLPKETSLKEIELIYKYIVNKTGYKINLITLLTDLVDESKYTVLQTINGVESILYSF